MRAHRLQVGHIRFGYCLVLRVSVVQVHLGPPKNILADNNRKYGGVAQLGEHLPCKQGVRSSILLVSTILLNLEKYIEETEKKETS